MPRVPTAPLPEFTTRGTKRKNRLYCPEEKVQKALELIRQGVFILRAARICDVPEKRLQARVRDLRARGELDIFWGKNAPGYLEKIKKETGEDPDEEATVEEVGPDGKKKKKKIIERSYTDYTPEQVYAAANAVREGLYTLNSAHHIFQVPRRVIRKVLNGETLKGKPQGLAQESEFVKIMGKMGPVTDEVTPTNWRHFASNKLSPEEEQLIVNYSLALYNLNQPVTLKSIFPLTNRLLEERGQVVRDPHCWFKAFVVRHPALANKTFTTTDIYKMKPDFWIGQVLTRLTNVYDTHNFHVKPSRIYSWHSMQYSVERWEPDQANYINVDILVAANAVGYHILPPCVVYANDGAVDVPDFLGLPEAGFVASDETRKGTKILTPAILVEWFRSVFLQYLPSRSPDDPVALLLPGSYDWITPELVSLAEQNCVHLIPINPKVLEQLSPLLILLNQLKESYQQTLATHREKNLPKQAKEPASEAFFPVKFRKLFSSCFSMYNIQEAFKTTGIFPLNPERFNSEQIQTENEPEPGMLVIENVTTKTKSTTTPKSGNTSNKCPGKDHLKPKLIKYSDIDLKSQNMLVLKPSFKAKPSSSTPKPVSITKAATDDDAADSDYTPPTDDIGATPGKKTKTRSSSKGPKKPPRNVAIEILPVGEGKPTKDKPVTSGSDSKTAAPPTSAATCIIRHKASVSTATPGSSTASTESLGQIVVSSYSKEITTKPATLLEDNMIILKDAQSGAPIQRIPVTVSLGGSNCFVLQKATVGNTHQTGTTTTIDSSSKPILSIGTTTGESSSASKTQPIIFNTGAQPKVGTSSIKPPEKLQEAANLDILSKAFGGGDASAFTTTEDDGTVIITLTGVSGDITEQQITLESPGTSETPVVLMLPETHEPSASKSAAMPKVTEVTEQAKTISKSSDTVTLSVDEEHEKSVIYQNAQILSSLALQVSENLTRKPPQPDLSSLIHKDISGKVGSGNIAPVTSVVIPAQMQVPTLIVNPKMQTVQPVAQPVLSTNSPVPTMTITSGNAPVAQPVLSTNSTVQTMTITSGNAPVAQPVLSTNSTVPTMTIPPGNDSNPATVSNTPNLVATMIIPGNDNNPSTVSQGNDNIAAVSRGSDNTTTVSRRSDNTTSNSPSSSASSAVRIINKSKESEQSISRSPLEKQSVSSSDLQDHAYGVPKALDEETNSDSATSSGAVAKSSDVSSIARKSPRKQTLVVKISMDSESDRDTISTSIDKSQGDDPSKDARKRKGSTSQTDEVLPEQSKKAKTVDVESGLSEKKVNRSEESKNVKTAGDESGSSETRMTRAKTKEEASPSRRTRSKKN